jgi:F0F1-type ATP synthase assembly protein I
MIALPVLAGLAVGFWLDNQLGTLPWISLLLALIGSMVGPVALYRWVTSVVGQRMGRPQGIEERKEGKEEDTE